MLIVWAPLLLCLLACTTSDAAAGFPRPPRPPQSARHYSAPRPPLLTGHAQQTRLPARSQNSATRTGARPTTSARSLKGSGSPRGSPNLLAASTKKKKKDSHLFFLRLKPNKAVPAVSTTTPKPTEAPIFIIKSTPHPGEPPVFIVKTTPAPKPPAPWPSNQRPSSMKPGHQRPTMNRPRPPAYPASPSAKPQSVHYHWHQHGPAPQGAHHVKYIVKTKTSYPRIRPPPPQQPVRPPPQRFVLRPKPQTQSLKQPLRVHHMHQHLHHHLVPATQIIIRKRPQDPPPPPKRRPWSFFK